MGKKILINALMFIAGAATGAFVTYKYLEQKFETILEDEVDAVKHYAKKKIQIAKLEQDVARCETKLTSNDKDVISDLITEEKINISNIKLKDLDTDEDIVIDGDGVYHANHVYFEEDSESSEDNEEEEEEIEFDDDFIIEPPSKLERMKIPFIISSREFAEEMEHFDKISLNYYAGDETFADDQDELIDDIRMLVGDAYEYFGANPDDPDVVYVRNFRLSTDFELCRVYGRYSDTIAGHYRTDVEDEFDYE